MTLRLITANDVCAGMEAALIDHVPTVLASTGWDTRTTARLRALDADAWRQMPTPEALRDARKAFPSGAVTSPGLVEPPVRHSDGYDLTFRVEVVVFDRGSDWDETAQKIRDWAAVVFAAAHVDRSLGGIADGLNGVGESYRRLTGIGADRTLGGASVEFDVYVPNARPLAALPYLDGSGTPSAIGVVADTHSTVTARPLT